MKFPRVRFSIFTLLVTMAVIAVGLVLWERWVAWPRAQAEFATICQMRPTEEDIRRIESLIDVYPIFAKDPLAVTRAAEFGDVELCRRLVKMGCPIDGADGHQTPFYFAIKNNRSEVVSFLLAQGADATSPSSLGPQGKYQRNPLYLAASEGYPDVCDLLIEAGADVNVGRPSMPPLRIATLLGHLDTCHLLVEKGADIREGLPDNPLLVNAIATGQPELVKLLLDHGATMQIHPNHTIRSLVEDLTTWNQLLDKAPLPQQKDKIIQLLQEHLPRPASEPKEGASP